MEINEFPEKKQLRQHPETWYLAYQGEKPVLGIKAKCWMLLFVKFTSLETQSTPWQAFA